MFLQLPGHFGIGTNLHEIRHHIPAGFVNLLFQSDSFMDEMDPATERLSGKSVLGAFA